MSSLFANAVPDKSRKVCRLSAFCTAAAARTRGRRFVWDARAINPGKHASSCN